MAPAAASSTDWRPGTPAPGADRVLWVPVRHHSPAAARAVAALIAQHRPEAVLIEGPAEYSSMDQLDLDHRLPIAIMTWVRYVADRRERQSHALYPLTVFSAEWQALRAARAAGLRTEFIDLPWAESYALRLALAARRSSSTEPDGVPFGPGGVWPGERVPDDGGPPESPEEPERPEDAAATVTAALGMPVETTPDPRAVVHGVDALGEETAAVTLTDATPSRGFFETIAAHVGREDMSAVWDEFFEIDPALTPEEYLTRAATIGAGLRLSADDGEDGPDGPENVARERHMAARIAAVLAETTGPVLVLTGAFHTSGLHALLAGEAAPALDVEPVALPGLVTGTALVPTSYEVLDENRGYLAGQPSPGFYQRVFEAAPGRQDAVVTSLFSEAVAALRRKKVPLSPADAIAAMTTAKALQELRGHARMWRDDLLDGIAAAVVKDEVDERHPLLEILLEILRGDVVGRLAEGADVPPLVHEVRRRWAEAGLPTERVATPHLLDLNLEHDREVSRLLHALNVLEIPAAQFVTAPGGGRVSARDTLASTERWALGWPDRTEAELILASRWGGSLEQAVTAVLEHRARVGTAAVLAAVLTDAVRSGLTDVSGRLGRALVSVLAACDELGELGGALDALVRLVHFDTWLGAVGRADLADLARFAHERTTAVLERLGPVSDGPALGEMVNGLRTLAETTVTLGDRLGLDTAAVTTALAKQTERPPGSPGHDPEFEGALIGAGWLLSGDPGKALEARIADPAATGRFYSGLLTVAGHLAIAAPQIFTAADDALRHWADDDFLSALPDLRRAMAGLSARERAALLTHLTGERRAVPRLAVDAATMVALGRRESRLWDAVAAWTGGAA